MQNHMLKNLRSHGKRNGNVYYMNINRRLSWHLFIIHDLHRHGGFKITTNATQNITVFNMHSPVCPFLEETNESN